MNTTATWLPMDQAPKTAEEVEVLLADEMMTFAHYACDFSGEYQPGFEGWFERQGKGYVEIKPLAWRPLHGGTIFGALKSPGN